MAASNGIISKIADLEAITRLEGHHKLTAYRLLKAGEKGSLHLMVSLDVLEPGGSTDAHYHTDGDIFDHAFYVISGDLIISVAGKEQKVGADTLIYCRSNQTHSMTNVGTGKAKVLAISASAAGTDMPGKMVYPK